MAEVENGRWMSKLGIDRPQVLELGGDDVFIRGWSRQPADGLL